MSISHGSVRPRVAAVSYLNTVPLIWGYLQGPQRPDIDLLQVLPAKCADLVAASEADVGLLPVVEIARQKLSYFPEIGIACRGPVRSILLVSKVPIAQIRTIAWDHGSRTSVMLTRVVLHLLHGIHPEGQAQAPNLPAMLATADAALLIGDAALRVDPAKLPYHVLDLGQQWFQITGLPMVFALWAGRPSALTHSLRQSLLGSWHYGQERLPEIIDHQADRRGMMRSLVRDYFHKHIVFALGEDERKGMQEYLRQAALLEPGLAAYAEQLQPAAV